MVVTFRKCNGARYRRSAGEGLALFCYIRNNNLPMEHDIPQLSAEELRVLGTLIEKSKTTPDYYPMTLNALTAGCNQKSSRRPVMELEEAVVQAAINSLKGRSLVATAVGAGSRVVKYKHNFLTLFEVSDAQLALLCLLFLRGPQTAGELNANSGRLYEFASLESLLGHLEQLAQAQPPYVKELPRRTGQKERRFAHLFGDVPEETEETGQDPQPRSSVAQLEERLSQVEQELAVLRDTVARLMKELTGEG